MFVRQNFVRKHLIQALKTNQFDVDCYPNQLTFGNGELGCRNLNLHLKTIGPTSCRQHVWRLPAMMQIKTMPTCSISDKVNVTSLIAKISSFH